MSASANLANLSPLATKIRLAIRGYAGSELMFEERFEISEWEIDTLLPAVAERHATALCGHLLHMFEIEFLDELNPNDRFFRFGTDPRGMIMALRMDLSGRPS